MTPESRHNSLLGNGSLKFPARNEYAGNNRGIVGNNVFYSVRALLTKDGGDMFLRNIPCGGRVEYLQRSPARRRRRRKHRREYHGTRTRE
jgi:hypothetical protein